MRGLDALPDRLATDRPCCSANFRQGTAMVMARRQSVFAVLLGCPPTGEGSAEARFSSPLKGGEFLAHGSND